MALTLKLEVEFPPADYPTLPYHVDGRRNHGRDEVFLSDKAKKNTNPLPPKKGNCLRHHLNEALA